MKVAVTEGKGDIRLVDVSVPKPGPYQCLCRMTACATCSGTDIKIISNKLPWEEKYPAIVGHESVGVVIETGEKVRNINIGESYLRPTAVYPGDRLEGYHSIWGGFAEYGLVTDLKAMKEDKPSFEPGYTQFQAKVPDELNLSAAEAIMLITIKETAGYVLDLNSGLNDAVVVMGAGPVAMSMCFFAKLRGAFPLIVVARRDEPLDYIKRFGVNFTVNNFREDALKKVMDITGGKGAKYIIETTGDAGILSDSLSMLSDDGKIAPYAVYPSGAVQAIDSSKIINASTGEVRTEKYINDLAGMGTLNLKNFYSDVMPFSDIEEGFELIKSKKAFKVVFEMEEK